MVSVAFKFDCEGVCLPCAGYWVSSGCGRAAIWRTRSTGQVTNTPGRHLAPHEERPAVCLRTPRRTRPPAAVTAALTSPNRRSAASVSSGHQHDLAAQGCLGMILVYSPAVLVCRPPAIAVTCAGISI